MSDFPKIQLETFIILPFEIAGSKDWKNSDLEKCLTKSGSWVKLDSHESDRIGLREFDAFLMAELNQKDSLAEEKNEHLKNHRYQAYNYFHPFVRRFWFDRDIVQRYRRQDAHTLKADINPSWTKSAVAVEFDLVCDLLHFVPEIGILVLHIKSKENLDFQLAQECLDRLRRVYPPYLGKKYGGHFPDAVEILDASGHKLAEFHSGMLPSFRDAAEIIEGKIGDEAAHIYLWAKHWQHLLSPIGTDHREEHAFMALQLGDDRAGLASQVYVCDDKNISQKPGELLARIDRGNMIRLCLADPAGSDRLPYSEQFLDGFEERYCYDRFWYQNDESADAPSRIMNCGYAFTWLGDKRDRPFFSNEINGAPVTFRHLYVPMAIFAHFQKAALLVTARRLADLNPYDKENRKSRELDASAFQELKADFIAFTQTYWFDEVTPQEQGKELFEMWRRELRLQPLYDEMRQELQDIVEFVNSKEEQKQTKQAGYLNRIAMWFAIPSLVISLFSLVVGIVGLAASILGVNTFEVNGKPSLQLSSTNTINDIVQNIVSYTVNVVIAVFFIAVILGLFGWRKYKGMKNEK